MATALITGASNGIGLELAKIFAREKNNLVLVARSGDKLDALATEMKNQYGVQVYVLAKDLSGLNAASEIFEYCTRENIQIDFLINNAGFGDSGFFVDSDWNKQLEMINLNITALSHLTRLFLPSMVQKKSGRIMNVASTAAFQPGPLMSVYFATKAYVLSFSEAISNELENTGVTVTALCPGATATGFQKAASLENSKMIKDRKIPSAASVAEYGYNAMMKGKVVAIHGFFNTLLATSIRFSPRGLVRKIVRNMNKA